MKKSVVFLFMACFVISALSTAENQNDIKPPATASPPKPFNPTQSPKPTIPTTKPTTPTTTTTKPTTTTTKPTTTTTKPTTTTTTPTTKPTTTTPSTKPTTAPTTTTTTAKPTTTTMKTTSAPPPEPTPPTNLTVGQYDVKDKGKTCLKARMAVQMRVSNEINGTFIVQPDATTAEGTCGEKEAELKLSFREGSITFLFNKSDANIGYVNSLSFKIDYAFVKGQMKTYQATNGTVHLFSAKAGHSYSCKNETINMGNGLFLDITQNTMQAFDIPSNGEFGSPDFCAADRADYSVAIGVGIALLVLIIIVVVAYLLTRRRRTDGYQSL